jgi:hypothetical protein
MRRAMTTVVISVFIVLGLLSPASADVVSKADPTGDVPDITRLTLDNRQKVMVGRVRYADVAQVVQENYRIDWDSSVHYKVFVKDYDSESAGFEFRLYRWVPEDGYGYGEYYARVKCKGVTGSRDFEEDILSLRVPRKCIPSAPNKIRAQAVAYAAGDLQDDTELTPYAKRG